MPPYISFSYSLSSFFYHSESLTKESHSLFLSLLSFYIIAHNKQFVNPLIIFP